MWQFNFFGWILVISVFIEQVGPAWLELLTIVNELEIPKSDGFFGSFVFQDLRK